jgi:hypothetical protein
LYVKRLSKIYFIIFHKTNSFFYTWYSCWTTRSKKLFDYKHYVISYLNTIADNLRHFNKPNRNIRYRRNCLVITINVIVVFLVRIIFGPDVWRLSRLIDSLLWISNFCMIWKYKMVINTITKAKHTFERNIKTESD